MNGVPARAKILIISLSNIGDVVMTLPLIDILKRDRPEAVIDFMVGPKGEGLVKGNPSLRKVIIYRKKQPLVEIIRFLRALRAERYDLVIDLRNTLIPFLVHAKRTTPLMVSRPRKTGHMRFQHLARLRSAHPCANETAPRVGLYFSAEDRERSERVLGSGGQRFVVFAPGAAFPGKRWNEERFAQVAETVAREFGVKIVLLGDNNDREMTGRMRARMKVSSIDAAGELTLLQSAYVISKAAAVIANDSAPMHLASYLNIPVAALFGPTDPLRYGPWSDRSLVITPESHGSPAPADDPMALITVDRALGSLIPWLRGILHEQKTV